MRQQNYVFMAAKKESIFAMATTYLFGRDLSLRVKN